MRIGASGDGCAMLTMRRLAGCAAATTRRAISQPQPRHSPAAPALECLRGLEPNKFPNTIRRHRVRELVGLEATKAPPHRLAACEEEAAHATRSHINALLPPPFVASTKLAESNRLVHVPALPTHSRQGLLMQPHLQLNKPSDTVHKHRHPPTRAAADVSLHPIPACEEDAASATRSHIAAPLLYPFIAQTELAVLPQGLGSVGPSLPASTFPPHPAFEESNKEAIKEQG